MVWGCMGWNGMGMLIEVEGKMDADILSDGIMESFEKLEIEEGEQYFQQNNDPKHTSQKATQWFGDNNIEVLPWPAQSSDLNPIETLWKHIKQQVCKYETSPKGAHDLWKRLVDEWNKIPPEVC